MLVIVCPICGTEMWRIKWEIYRCGNCNKSFLLKIEIVPLKGEGDESDKESKKKICDVS
jgi:DNA-directed RNA polymerase subunit RPC12/RpoP